MNEQAKPTNDGIDVTYDEEPKIDLAGLGEGQPILPPGAQPQSRPEDFGKGRPSK